MELFIMSSRLSPRRLHAEQTRMYPAALVATCGVRSLLVPHNEHVTATFMAAQFLGGMNSSQESIFASLWSNLAPILSTSTGRCGDLSFVVAPALSA